MGLYDLDFHAWSSEQAELLKRRSANELDWDNIAEEIESLGKQQRSELRNRLVVLLTHLLKWEFQPEARTRSWTNTIAVQRRDTADLLAENPSLKASHDEAFERAYANARNEASTQTDLPVETFPIEPPFTLEQALDPDWLPGEPDQSSPTASKGS